MSEGLRRFESKYQELAGRVRGIPASVGPLAPWKASTSSSERLLARWLRGANFPEDSAIALSGVGDGSHIEALLGVMPKSGLVFCGEPDCARFRAFLNTPLAKALLEDPRVAFGVGTTDEDFFAALASVSVMEYENAEPLIFAPLFSEAEEYYAGFFREFAQRLDVYRKLYGTALTKSGLWQGNSIRNLPSLIRSPDPDALHDVFDGVPMVLAGAGPSLDESLEFLRWAQSRAVIVAGNSSIRALVNGGVQPHFVLAADPFPTTDSGFEGVDLGETILACPFLVYPNVVKRFEGRVTAWSRNNLLASYFRKASGVNRLEHVTEQGTVSACSFDLARILGCSALFFVGQDLAARTDGRMHASDSFYLDAGEDRTNLDACRWCRGNTIEKVPVEEKLFVYLKTFDQLSKIYSQELKLKDGKGLALYNLSRLGARIEHMPYVDFEEAKTLLESSASKSVESGWKRARSILSSYSIGWGRVGKVLREFRSYVEGVCSFALKQALALEVGGEDLAAFEEARAVLDKLIDGHSEFAEILKDGQLNMELYVHNRAKTLRNRRHEDDSPDSRLEIIKGYFWAVAEGSYQVLAALDDSEQGQRG